MAATSTITVTSADSAATRRVIPCLDWMAEDYKLLSRKRLQEWFLPHCHKKPELADLSKGQIYCILLWEIFPQVAGLQKGLKTESRGEWDNRHNLLLLQKSLKKLGVRKDMNLETLAKSNVMANWEFARWFIYFCDVNRGVISHTQPPPSTTRTRRMSMASVASSRLSLAPAQLSTSRFSLASTFSFPATPMSVRRQLRQNQREENEAPRTVSITSSLSLAATSMSVHRLPKFDQQETPKPVSSSFSLAATPTSVRPKLDEKEEETPPKTATIATQTERLTPIYEEEMRSRQHTMPRDSIEISCSDGTVKKYRYTAAGPRKK